jgi:TatD DNase family protein
MLIDTHAHLNFSDFDKDLDQLVEDSVKAGVEKIICVSSNLEDSKKAIEIAKKYPGTVMASVGIHPHQTDPKNQNSVEVQAKELEELAKNPEVVGIGECGLDYSDAPPGEKDRSKEEQIFLFETQIKLAQKLKLPISVHCRKATKETIEVLNKHFISPKYAFGVWHCYSAGKKEISKITELGLSFGIDGNITYDQGLQNVIKDIPLEKIILETDCPFLSPIPYRGLRNTPANVKISAEFIAQLLGYSFDQVSEITTKNAQRIYHQTR